MLLGNEVVLLLFPFFCPLFPIPSCVEKTLHSKISVTAMRFFTYYLTRYDPQFFSKSLPPHKQRLRKGQLQLQIPEGPRGSGDAGTASLGAGGVTHRALGGGARLVGSDPLDGHRKHSR